MNFAYFHCHIERDTSFTCVSLLDFPMCNNVGDLRIVSGVDVKGISDFRVNIVPAGAGLAGTAQGAVAGGMAGTAYVAGAVGLSGTAHGARAVGLVGKGHGAGMIVVV